MTWAVVNQLPILNTDITDAIDRLKEFKKQYGKHTRLSISNTAHDLVLLVETLKPVLTPEEAKQEAIKETLKAYAGK
jgi:hypothetical protein